MFTFIDKDSFWNEWCVYIIKDSHYKLHSHHKDYIEALKTHLALERQIKLIEGDL